MTKHIAIIQGHPDGQHRHYGHALADAYSDGATKAGHEVRIIEVAKIEFPLLHSKEEFDTGVPPEPIRQAQDTIRWAEHLVILYPLWLGSMPALLKAFLEQTFRPGFATPKLNEGSPWKKLLAGKSARVIVTMGMPAFFYRWYFRAHSLKSLERNILAFCGIGPIKESLIGLVEAKNGKREKWLGKMRTLGSQGK